MPEPLTTKLALLVGAPLDTGAASCGDAEAVHPQSFDLDGRRFHELPR